MFTYAFVVCTLIAWVYSFLFMIRDGSLVYMPKSWGEKYYSKTRLAIYLNKKNRKISSLRIDLFREIPFWIYFFVFLVSLIVLIIDISNENFISVFLGKKIIGIISISLLVSFFVYVIVLSTVWRFINRKDIVQLSEDEEKILYKILKDNYKRGKKKNNKTNKK